MSLSSFQFEGFEEDHGGSPWVACGDADSVSERRSEPAASDGAAAAGGGVDDYTGRESAPRTAMARPVDSATEHMLSSSVPISVPSSALSGLGPGLLAGSAELDVLSGDDSQLSKSFMVPSSYSRPVPVCYGIAPLPQPTPKQSRKAELLDRLLRAAGGVEEEQLEALVALAEAQKDERAQRLAEQAVAACQQRPLED